MSLDQSCLIENNYNLDDHVHIDPGIKNNYFSLYDFFFYLKYH